VDENKHPPVRRECGQGMECLITRTCSEDWCVLLSKLVYHSAERMESTGGSHCRSRIDVSSEEHEWLASGAYGNSRLSYPPPDTLEQCNSVANSRQRDFPTYAFYENPGKHFSVGNPVPLKSPMEATDALKTIGSLVYGEVISIAERGALIKCHYLRFPLQSKFSNGQSQWRETAVDISHFDESVRLVFCPTAHFDSPLVKSQTKIGSNTVSVIRCVRSDGFTDVTMRNDSLTDKARVYVGFKGCIPNPLGDVTSRKFLKDMERSMSFLNPETPKNYFNDLDGTSDKFLSGMLSNLHTEMSYFGENCEFFDSIKKQQSRDWATVRVLKGKKLKKSRDFEKAYKSMSEALTLDPTYGLGQAEMCRLMVIMQEKDPTRFTESEMTEAKTKFNEYKRQCMSQRQTPTKSGTGQGPHLPLPPRIPPPPPPIVPPRR